MSTDPTSAAPLDPSPYIRTYAKDVAALTGQKPTALNQTISKEEPPAERHDDSLIVSTAPSSKPADLSELERDAERTDARKESEQEAEDRIQDIGNASSSGLLQSISLPPLQVGDIVQAATPPQQDDGNQREAILARLRAKVNQAKPATTPLTPSSFAMAPRVEATSEVSTPEVPIAPPPPAPPLPPPVVEEKASPFHSFSSDFADRIDEQKASTFSVLAAEKDAARQKPRAKANLNLLPILAGVVLVIAGGAGVFAAYKFMTSNAPIVATPATSYLIAPDEKIALSGTGGSLLDALANQATQPIPTNTVLMTYITTSSTTKQGVVQAPDTGGAFLSALNLSAPDILLRNIDPSSMVGIVNDGTQTRAFFILRVDSYESTFAGMLAWEGSIDQDLAVLYPEYPAPVQPVAVVATSTATSTTTTKKQVSTTPITPVPIIIPQEPPRFIDEVVDNHSARALKDSEGRTILIYGYADKQTLIIAREEAAFTLLLGRLAANTGS